MQKICKKIITLTLGAVMAASAASLAGCAKSVKLDGDFSSGEVTSNGGFVVEKGNYIYFINGQESYTTENNGEAVKGSLMRILTSDFKSGDYGKCEIVVPYLMVAANYDAGIYIYGDRVYYATPTNAKDIDSGSVQNTYLDFKSTKLDGTDTVKNYYFRASSNSAAYRFTEVDGVVYCLHVDDDDIWSYDTQNNVDTLLVKDASDITFDNSSSESARVYYTMSVTIGADTANPYEEKYTQLYSVTADAKMTLNSDEASYTVNGGKTYDFDKDYLEDSSSSFDKKDITTYPYVNLGTLVLDGIGSSNDKTMFNGEGTGFTPSGYTYSVIQADNGGVYYTRSNVDTTSSTGDGGWLYYLSESSFTASGWNCIDGNNSDDNEFISYDTTNASASAIFYREDGKNYYLYASGSEIYRAAVPEKNGAPVVTRIATEVSSATLLYIEKNGSYGYLYYSMSNSNGNAIYRAVYNGEETDYNLISANKNYQPVKILDVDYTSDWYSPEIIENKLVFTNAESIGSSSYNYVCVVSLEGKNGMMTNSEISDFNDLYEDVTDAISDMDTDDSDLSNLMEYYFYTNGFKYPVTDVDPDYYGNTDNYYDSVLAEAKNRGYSDTYLYSKTYQEEFKKVIAREKGDLADYTFKDSDGNYYGTRDYFYGDLGKISDSDAEEIFSVWKTSYVLTLTEEKKGMAAWETWQLVLFWVGIGVAIALVLAAAIIVPLVIIRKKKKARQEAIDSAQPGLHHTFEVDTTDDKSVDVYADDTDENAENADNADVEAAKKAEAADGAEVEEATEAEVKTATKEAPEAVAEEANEAAAEETAEEKSEGKPDEATDTSKL